MHQTTPRLWVLSRTQRPRGMFSFLLWYVVSWFHDRRPSFPNVYAGKRLPIANSATAWACLCLISFIQSHFAHSLHRFGVSFLFALLRLFPRPHTSAPRRTTRVCSPGACVKKTPMRHSKRAIVSFASDDFTRGALGRPRAAATPTRAATRARPSAPHSSAPAARRRRGRRGRSARTSRRGRATRAA